MKSPFLSYKDKYSPLICRYVSHIFLALLICWITSGTSRAGERVTLYYQNDLHGWFFPTTQTRGLPAVLDELKEAKKSDNNVFYVVAGDIFTGPDFPQELKGKTEIEIWKQFRHELDKIGIGEHSILTLGNHEFDYGFMDAISGLEPIVANIVDKEGRPVFNPYKKVSIGRISVAFIGLILDDYPKVNRSLEEKGFKVIDPLVAIRSYQKNICNADLTVAVIHENISKIKELAESLSQDHCIDVFLTGHSHIKTETPITIGEKYIVQAGSMNQYLGKLTLDVKDRKVKLVENTISSLEPHSFDYELIKVKELVDERNGRAIAILKKSLILPRSGTPRDTSLGNLVADAMRWKGKTDIALISSGSIRREFYVRSSPIPLREGDVRAIYPFPNKLVRISLRGKELLRFLEAEAQGFETQISGFSYVVDTKGRAEKALIGVQVGGANLDPQREYTCTISSYMARPENNKGLMHGVSFKKLENGEESLVDQAIREYAKYLKVIDYEPEGDGRIRTVR